MPLCRVSGGNRTTSRSAEPTRHHSVNEPGPSGISRIVASNPAEPAGIVGEIILCSGSGERDHTQSRG